jgi:hypothetical protein
MPGHFVARLWRVESGGKTVATGIFRAALTLKTVRAMLPDGLVNIGRRPDDEPHIVEVWM